MLTPFGRGLLAQAKRLLDEGERLHRLAAEAHARLGADEYDSDSHRLSSKNTEKESSFRFCAIPSAERTLSLSILSILY